MSYDIVTQNNGPSTADNITITDSIIPGLTGVIVSNDGTYDSISGIVTFPPVTLTNAASVTRNISFIAPASGSVSNTARSTSATPDQTPGNNDGTAPGASVITTLTPTPTPNQPPAANSTNLTLGPNSSAPVPGLGGSDPDGSIASYTITSVPPANQGVLLLSDSVNGDVPVTAGQVLTPAQIGQLFFVATVDFNGATFSYTATDNNGKISPASATVAAILRPVGTVPPLTPTPTPTPAPGISNPIAEPDTDCLCQPIPEKPGINFAPPQQPPAVGFVRPISQLGEGQTTKGTDGDDLIADTKGNQKILGLQGNDVLLGENDADEIHGDGGNDAIFAGTDTDIAYGGDGNDIVHAGKQNDWIAGDLGADILFGDRGADTILGDHGNNDRSTAENGDFILGGNGADIINGNEGNDTIHAGKDNDFALGGTLIGGIGSDRFVLSADGGTDTVINFEVGVDKFVLTGGVSFQQLQFSATPDGTLLPVAGTDRVLGNFIGVNGAIGSSDFRSNLLSEG